MKDPVKLGRVNSSGNLFWVDIISIRARVISSFQNTAPRISEKHRKCRIAWFLRCLKKSLWSMSSYLHSLIGAGKWEAQLLCTKSKVASFKSVSLPQLELCGVLLLSQLMSKIKTAFITNIIREYYWSTIVLVWINDLPSRWKTFIANKLQKYRGACDHQTWCHIISRDNPADLIFRRTSPQTLPTSILWWLGFS